MLWVCTADPEPCLQDPEISGETPSPCSKLPLEGTVGTVCGKLAVARALTLSQLGKS